MVSSLPKGEKERDKIMQPPLRLQVNKNEAKNDGNLEEKTQSPPAGHVAARR